MEYDVLIRPENEKDFEEIEDVIVKTFAKRVLSKKDEHEIIKKLRDSDDYINELSLVAEYKDEYILGYLIFSKIYVKDEETNKEYLGLGLGPIGVLARYRFKGIGKKLINYGLEKAKELGYEFCVVLGDPDYYKYFGFETAIKKDIKIDKLVPLENFMVKGLNDDVFNKIKGTAHYSSVFYE